MNDRLPFPDPTTRTQARANALFFARVVHRTLGTDGKPVPPSQTAVSKAQMWAQIAQAFPEDELDTVTLMADDQPVQRTAEVRTVAVQEGPTVTVEASVWNVLRALAIWYVHTSLGREVRAQSDAIMSTEDVVLRLHWPPEENTVVVTAENAPVVR